MLSSFDLGLPDLDGLDFTARCRVQGNAAAPQEVSLPEYLRRNERSGCDPDHGPGSCLEDGD
jgi:hypothetical protein